ncbi:MAG: hypothetical protein EAX96_03915 [Candidatus Lokiarchaeota archaeon]|nr:hypothetical protein [Candidatus Lokiarchaeota archaeon]
MVLNLKEDIVKLLESIYTSDVIGANAAPSPTYEVFEEILKQDNAYIFFDLWDSNHPTLRAWAFHGITQLFKEKTVQDIADQLITSKIRIIIKELLQDDREIYTMLGCRLTHKKLNDVHIHSIYFLDNSVKIPPLFEYCNSEKTETNYMIGHILENYISKVEGIDSEYLLIKHAEQAKKYDFETKHLLIEGIKRYYYNFKKIENIIQLKSIFLEYLNEIYEHQIEKNTNISIDQRYIFDYKADIEANIIFLANTLDLDFIRETINFIINLQSRQSWVLRDIMEKFTKNQEYISLILEKLSTTSDLSLGSNILRGMIRTNFPNWKEYARNYVLTNKRIDLPTLREMLRNDAINKEIILTCLTHGITDQLMFISEFFDLYPEKFDEWEKFRLEFEKILRMEEPADLASRFGFFDRKKLCLLMVKKLMRNEYADYVLENLKFLKNGHLRVIAAESIAEIGRKEHLNQLEKLLETDIDIETFSKDGKNPILKAINNLNKKY